MAKEPKVVKEASEVLTVRNLLDISSEEEKEKLIGKLTRYFDMRDLSSLGEISIQEFTELEEVLRNISNLAFAELIKSEKIFIEKMRNVRKNKKAILEEIKKNTALSETEKALFAKMIDDMVEILNNAELLLEELKKIGALYSNKDDKKLENCVEEAKKILEKQEKLFAQYTINYPSLQAIYAKKKFKNYIDNDAKKEEGSKFEKLFRKDIGSAAVLAEPMQRSMRYSLSLKEVIKSEKDGSVLAKYNELLAATDKMADEINKAKRKDEQKRAEAELEGKHGSMKGRPLTLTVFAKAPVRDYIEKMKDELIVDGKKIHIEQQEGRYLVFQGTSKTPIAKITYNEISVKKMNMQTEQYEDVIQHSVKITFNKKKLSTETLIALRGVIQQIDLAEPISDKNIQTESGRARRRANLIFIEIAPVEIIQKPDIPLRQLAPKHEKEAEKKYVSAVILEEKSLPVEKHGLPQAKPLRSVRPVVPEAKSFRRFQDADKEIEKAKTDKLKLEQRERVLSFIDKLDKNIQEKIEKEREKEQYSQPSFESSRVPDSIEALHDKLVAIQAELRAGKIAQEDGVRWLKMEIQNTENELARQNSFLKILHKCLDDIKTIEPPPPPPPRKNTPGKQ